MFSRPQLKELAKSQLKGRWNGPVLLTLVFGLIGLVISLVSMIPGGSIVSLILSGPLMVGMIMYYLKFIQSDSSIDMSVAFQGFGIFAKSLGMYLWYLLWVILWTLLFFIPGIIKSISYSQCFFIIAENPNIKVTDALKISMKMTKGYKGALFVMYLSFLGWALLSILTLGIGCLWLYPYIIVSYTNAYHKLKELSLESGACTKEDFEGIVKSEAFV